MNLNNLPYYPNILLVTGNGKNVGKTSLSCTVIEHFKEEKIIGVKISPHFHEFDSKVEDVLYQTDNIIIIEEHRNNTGKDSSKLKAAGAFRVFFVMVLDHNLQEAFDRLIGFSGTDFPMIIESAALRNIIVPSQFLLLTHIDRPEPKKSIEHLMEYVDHNITLSSAGHNFTPNNIFYIKGKWVFVSHFNK
ncbi:MAG: hypothetical protein KAG64_04065 [Bacteroidales bacterium]|nr:hypothetical protein [Bacteroidales bacterium]